MTPMIILVVVVMMQIDGKFCVPQKPKARGWMYRIASPEDLMLQLLSLPRRRLRTENNGENSTTDRDLLQLILTFNANSDSSNDDNDDDDDADTTSQDDLFC